MAGMITLDSVDLSDYGVIAIRGSYNDLVKMPSLKAVSSFSWDDMDFEDVDLNNRKLEPDNITLTFLMSYSNLRGLFTKRDLLLNALKADGWRYLYVEGLDQTFKLYYVGCDSATFIKGFKYRIKMALKFRLNYTEPEAEGGGGL